MTDILHYVGTDPKNKIGSVYIYSFLLKKMFKFYYF